MVTDERFCVDGELGKDVVLASREVRHIRNESKTNFRDGERVPLIITSGGWRPAVLPPDVYYLDASVYSPDEQDTTNTNLLLRMLKAAFGLSNEHPAAILYSLDGSELGR